MKTKAPYIEVRKFHSPENAHLESLCERWAQLVQQYSDSVDYDPQDAGEDIPSARKKPGGIFWHNENTCTGLLAAAAWSLRDDRSGGWAAATEVYCRRRGTSADRESVGRVDLFLQSPSRCQYLIEAKRYYCLNGDLGTDKVHAWKRDTFQQLEWARLTGFKNPTRVALFFVVPYSKTDSGAAGASFDACSAALKETDPHILAAAKLKESISWEDEHYCGAILIGFHLLDGSQRAEERHK